jgi:uncharacterized protein YndB with AHSA1/START domain
MPDILHDLPIKAPVSQVFDAISQPAGFNAWWTLAAQGEAHEGADYALFFGAEYDWRARVTRSVRDREFALVVTRAMDDWIGTTIAFTLETRDDMTWLRFSHTGWGRVTEHFRVSSFCWAMYLRILKRYIEFGESVPYERRLDV